MIGAVIKKIRNDLSMRQVDFAVAVDVSQSNLSKIERGIFFPSYDLAKRIVKFAKLKKVKFNINDFFTE